MSKKLFLSSLAMAVALPAMVVSVQAQEVRTEVAQDFTDVSKSYSFYKEIMAMTKEGIIKGYTDGTFKPSQSITRMHTAMMFERALELAPIRAGKEFKDVPKSHPNYDIVQKVYRAGIFDGKTDGNFGIADNLTRAQMAKVMVEAFDLVIHEGYIFSDVGESHWAKDYISSLYMSGITIGSDGKFMPSDSVSRAHYAAFLFRALNPDDAPKPEKPLQPTPPKQEVKPEPPKPDPPKPDNPGGQTIVGDKDIKKPSGWTPDKSKAHNKTAIDKIFNNGLQAGTGNPVGTVSIALERAREADYQAGLATTLKVIGSSSTVNDWIAGLNYAIKTGEIYIAPDRSYALYVTYNDFGTTVYFPH